MTFQTLVQYPISSFRNPSPNLHHNLGVPLKILSDFFLLLLLLQFMSHNLSSFLFNRVRSPRDG